MKVKKLKCSKCQGESHTVRSNENHPDQKKILHAFDCPRRARL